MGKQSFGFTHYFQVVRCRQVFVLTAARRNVSRVEMDMDRPNRYSGTEHKEVT
jgi:hypothetical protein